MSTLNPTHAVQVALVLLLSFLIGFEREEHKQMEGKWVFGGVRTFPLIGLVSYSLALVTSPDLLGWMLGFAVVGGVDCSLPGAKAGNIEYFVHLSAPGEAP